MPVTLDAESLHHALARLEEWDDDAAIDSRASLSWLGWDETSPLTLRRYDLMLHLWYVLPTKVLAPTERRLGLAATLGRLLELTPAAAYAPLCTAPETRALIERWDTDERRARRELKRLLDASGIEPPDTPLLAWGSVLGLEEAQIREEVATALEIAIEAGTLAPGSSGFKRRQADVVGDVLRREGRLEAIYAERLERWSDDHQSPARTAILARVADLIMAPTDDDVEDAVPLARWLLERAADGIALTQTGALNRALVREVVELRPDWWNTELFGPPHREDDIAPLGHLHDLLRETRLLRRSGRRLVATARARSLLTQPGQLLDVCAARLIVDDSFEAAVGELAAALLLAGERAHWDQLKTSVHAAIVEQGWRSDGAPPNPHQVAGTISFFFSALEALDLLAGSRREGRQELTANGRHALVVALRARALGPRPRLSPRPASARPALRSRRRR